VTQKNRPQRKLPGGTPPIVTYSRLREEELPDVYDETRAEARFDDEPIAEWEAVEVPPEPPLHARRRTKPLVEEVRVPIDPDRFSDEPDEDERPAKRERAKRSTGMRLVAVGAAAAVILGIGILVAAFMSSSTAPVSAPSLGESSPPPGTVPADEAAADAAPAVREIPLNSDGSPVAAPPAPPQSAATDPTEAEPVNTVPVAPPAPRTRPDPPPATATVAPDFDQAAPLPQPAMPTLPQAATPPPAATGNTDFISNIERTLQQSRGTSDPALSPSTQQPVQLAPPPQQLLPPQPQLLQPQSLQPRPLAPGELLPPPPPEPGFAPPPQTFSEPLQTFPQQPQQGQFVPPADIPMLDGANQPILLPGDYMIDPQ
jgi:hypothetical protein